MKKDRPEGGPKNIPKTPGGGPEDVHTPVSIPRDLPTGCLQFSGRKNAPGGFIQWESTYLSGRPMASTTGH